MKNTISAAVTAVILAFSSNAFAETLNYDFTMTIDSIDDAYYGVFDGFSVGDPLNVSVSFDTTGPSGSSVLIDVAGLDVQITGGWGGSWSDVQYYSGYWDSNKGTNAEVLVVNGVGVHSGTLTQEVYLNFAGITSGDFALTSGNLEFRLENSGFAKITAIYQGEPASVPELDPASAMNALALIGGGLTLGWSRRRREGTETLTSSLS